MENNKNETPEQKWDKVKKLIFKGNVPQDIENLMQNGFKESTSEHEKWKKLAVFMVVINERFDKFKNAT